MKILVTSFGGDISQSIGKILLEKEQIELHGCDISDKNAGKFIFPNSSTLLFQHLFGFQDLIWSIMEANNENIPTFHIDDLIDKKFYKGFNEYIL